MSSKSKKSKPYSTPPVAPEIPCQIYLITPPVIDDMDAFLVTLEKALAAAPQDNPVGALQLRLKSLEDSDLIKAGSAMKAIAHRYNTLLFINDRPDLAKNIGADGVHIGQQDMDYFSSRELLGEDAIIGVTCHNSKDLGLQAAESGADYVAFGAVFETKTKAAPTRCDLEILTWWNRFIEIPCVAIGGINVDNAKTVIEAGVDFIAISSGVWDYKDGPDAAIKQLSALCLAAHSA